MPQNPGRHRKKGLNPRSPFMEIALVNANDHQMSYKDLLELVELIKSCSEFGEFHLKLGDLEVDLRRVDAVAAPAALALPVDTAPAQQAPVRQPAAPQQAAAQQVMTQQAATQQRHGHVGAGELLLDAPGAQPSAAPGAASFPAGSLLIKSPMVGTFYRAPEPGARPFVEVGQAVDAQATVCIIEVMKLMNSIPAGGAGTVTHILVGDGDAVEFGQVLMVVAPS